MGFSEDEIARIIREREVKERGEDAAEAEKRRAEAEAIAEAKRMAGEFAELMRRHGVAAPYDFAVEYAVPGPRGLLGRRRAPEVRRERLCGVWAVRDPESFTYLHNPGFLVADTGELLPYLAFADEPVVFGVRLQPVEADPDDAARLGWERARNRLTFHGTAANRHHKPLCVPGKDHWDEAAATALRGRL